MKDRELVFLARQCLRRVRCAAGTLLTAFCLLCGQAPLQAQQSPVQTQYFLNPYVYNPAFVGSQGYTEVFLSHRRQWIEMEGAPVTSVLSMHLPTRSPMAFGANLYTTRQGLINTTGAMATAGYAVQLSRNQYLRGGLSLGFRSIGIDQNQANATDPSDPAFTSNFNNHIGLDVNAGLSYQLAGLTLGAAMSNPFRKPNPLDARMDKAGINPFSQLLLTAGYRIELQGVAVEPQVLYGRNNGGTPRMEALATVFLRDVVWVGGSYRNAYGPSFFGGVRLAEVMRIGYGYELATQQVNGIGRGSHELLLSYRFGEKKRKGPGNGRPPAEKDDFKQRYFRQEQRKADKAAKEKREEARKAEKEKQESRKQAEAESQAAQKKAAAESKAAATSGSMAARPPADAHMPDTEPTDSLEVPARNTAPGNKQGRPQAEAPATTAAPAGRKAAQSGPAATTQSRKNTAVKPAPRRGRPGTASTSGSAGPDKAVNQPTDAGQPPQAPQAEDKAPTEQNFQNLQRTVQATESNRPDEIPRGFYVVVGTFQQKENAQRFVKTLNGQGFGESGFKFSSETSYYYVYVLQTQNQEDARKQWARMRQIPGFEDTWVNVLHVQ